MVARCKGAAVAGSTTEMKNACRHLRYHDIPTPKIQVKFKARFEFYESLDD